MLRHVPYTGIRVLAFEQLRGLAQRTLGTQPGAPLPLPAGLAAGLVAGGLGQLVAVPADLVKVSMQVGVEGVRGARRWVSAVRWVSHLSARRIQTPCHPIKYTHLPAVRRPTAALWRQA
mgnify:CR=1 FL=1